MLAHVRKFVSGARYEGPTKAGLVMDGALLVSVISALTHLKDELPGAEQRQFAKIHKSGDTSIVVAIIPPDDLQALPSVDVREYVDSPNYSGPTKKGVRFSWDKLSEFIGILGTQAGRLGSIEKAQPILFPEARPEWVKETEKTAEDKKLNASSILRALMPEGSKDFPADFIDDKKKMTQVKLPPEPISIVLLPGGTYTVKSDFGFSYKVRNVTEGNFVYYAFLRGHRTVSIPTEMIEIFRAVKAYQNYLRDLRHALLQAFEQKSGHHPLAEHQAREAFKSYGLPWLE